MEQKQFYTFIDTPYSLSEEQLGQLRELLTDFPYFQAAQILYLSNFYGHKDYEHYLLKRGIHIPSATHYYKNLMLYKMYPQPNELNKRDGEMVIDTKPSVVEEKKLPPKGEEKIMYAPSFYRLEAEQKQKEVDVKTNQDFTSWLTILQQTNTIDAEKTMKGNPEAEKTALLISQFTKGEKKEGTKEVKDVPRKDYTPEQFMSQTLAEIYVKQKLYDRAIAIYEKLYLNSSKKNITFANRIEEINELKNI